jgi:SAM-dependent MidA family methyltransferase
MESRAQTRFNSEDTPLFEIVFQRIQKSQEGSISFSDYMELVLYHPEHGYYASPEERKVGRKGDFFTSVSVGPMFGFLLAQQIVVEWNTRLDAGSPLVIIEQGAHDGQLAADITAALRDHPEIDPTLITYRIVDPRAKTRAFLEKRFSDSPIRIEIVSTLEEGAAAQGIFLCNELLDAFPVDRIVYSNGEWKEQAVTREDDLPVWTERTLPPSLKPFCETLGGDFPEGYTTEICPGLPDWIRESSGLFDKGLWWIIDYGFEAEDYFSPHRKTGTLRCYRNHTATEDPFAFPGETDITAHVNFTHLREFGEAAGLKWLQYTDQHHFLIHAAKEWLLSMEGRPSDGKTAQQLRQFQTLTHPGLMGQQFKVAELGKNLS